MTGTLPEGAEAAPTADRPSNIKMTNRRRMAWLSLIAGLLLGVGVIVAAIAVPAIADRLDKIDMALVAVLSFLAGPVIVYVGGTYAVNVKHGK